jgi:hypothetical protein
LASSAHQILNSGGTYPIQEEGAGLISASWADDVLTGTMGNWGEVSYVCASPNPFLVATMPNLSSGLRTRVAIAWGQPYGYANYYMQPSADLNLVVKDSFGAIVSSFGNSHDETYEWIEFVTSIPGNYTINIQRRYCDAVSNSVVGYAWWQFH